MAPFKTFNVFLQTVHFNVNVTAVSNNLHIKLNYLKLHSLKIILKMVQQTSYRFILDLNTNNFKIKAVRASHAQSDMHAQTDISLMYACHICRIITDGTQTVLLCSIFKNIFIHNFLCKQQIYIVDTTRQTWF